MVICNLSFIANCSISSNIREGLLEAFYGVYEKDPDKVNLLKIAYCYGSEFVTLPYTLSAKKTF